MNGGTAVTLFGRGFSTSVSCRFNNQLVVSALFMTSHMISCVSPEATETGETLIDIGSDFTSPQVRPSKSAARVAVRSFSVASAAQVPVFYHSCNFTGPYTDEALKTVAKFPFVVK